MYNRHQVLSPSLKTTHLLIQRPIRCAFLATDDTCATGRPDARGKDQMVMGTVRRVLSRGRRGNTIFVDYTTTQPIQLWVQLHPKFQEYEITSEGNNIHETTTKQDDQMVQDETKRAETSQSTNQILRINLQSEKNK